MEVNNIRGWECDRCGWRWIRIEGKTPTHCSHCHSRRWNSGAGKDAELRGAGVASPGSPERSGNRGTVPVVPSTKSPAKRLHPVQQPRSELAQGRGSDQRPTQSSDAAIHGSSAIGGSEIDREQTIERLCRACEGQLAQMKGFWVCPDLTGCSLGGQQQGRV